MSGYIEWREKHKEMIRTIIMLVCVFGLVLEIWHLQGYVKVISSPEYNNADYLPSVLKQDNIISIEDFNEFNYIHNEPVIIDYNPVSKSIWSLLNIQFYLFIISLLWKSQE